KVLHQLKADTIPRITILNKTDNMDSSMFCEQMLHQFQPAVLTSALHAQGMDKLINSIMRLPMMRLKSVHIDVPINDQELLAWIQQHTNILWQEYQDAVISMDLEMLPIFAARLEKLTGGS
ncbi:MAG: hypothetical protein AAB110_06495, partial [Candidatus Desantisbacteria bacterium]